jgi:predicted nucleic acid-binding protein
VRYWDTSAIVPLLLPEAPRDALLELLERDPVMLVWWGTRIECTSAVARRERDGALGVADSDAALQRLRDLSAEWQEVVPADSIRTTAQRLLRVHPLRAADSLQLAAAIIAAGHEPATLEFVSLDARLNEAASREGFSLHAF